MAENAVGTNLFSLVVKQILRNLTERRNVSQAGKYDHVDVTVTRRGDSYIVRATKYGRYEPDIVRSIANILWTFPTDSGHSDTVRLARIYSRNEGNEREIVRDLSRSNDTMTIHVNDNAERFATVSYWKNYLSVELEHGLSAVEASSLEEFTVNEMNTLSLSYPGTKFTYHRGEKLLHNNRVRLDTDYRLCRQMSVAVANVIRQSFNNEFRERCFAALGIPNSYAAEDSLMRRLLPMIHDNYVLPMAENDSDSGASQHQVDRSVAFR